MLFLKADMIEEIVKGTGKIKFTDKKLNIKFKN